MRSTENSGEGEGEGTGKTRWVKVSCVNTVLFRGVAFFVAIASRENLCLVLPTGAII